MLSRLASARSMTVSSCCLRSDSDCGMKSVSVYGLGRFLRSLFRFACKARCLATLWSLRFSRSRHRSRSAQSSSSVELQNSLVPNPISYLKNAHFLIQAFFRRLPPDQSQGILSPLRLLPFRAPQSKRKPLQVAA